jgi:hypothetical protein
MWSVLSVGLLVAGLAAPPFAVADSGKVAPSGKFAHAFDGRRALREMGYVSARSPVHDAMKANATRLAARLHPGRPTSSPAGGVLAAPTIGPNWEGVSDATLSPPDTNGAIGPSSYIEIINLQMGIYTRAGSAKATGNLQTLTGHSQFNLSDPMILWDPDTRRFYYNVWDSTQASMAFGFSKTHDPTDLGASWCKYTATFGYATSNAPDYPKLGQTKNFLLIGVNFYPSFSSLLSTQSDLLWLSKPAGSAALTTCPSATTFKVGKFPNLKNIDGSQAFTPVPAIQADPSPQGYVVATADVENGSTGDFITVFQVKPSAADPTVPAISAPHQVEVPTYQAGPDAPQKDTNRLLDTLDGRLKHAVSSIDPRTGKNMVWTSHTVLGGAGTQSRWYEIKPTPLGTPTVFQRGAAHHANLYVFNDGISSDRTVRPAGSAHGSNMVMGFSTSSSTTFSAARMVSKVGSHAQSGFVLVKQSPGKNEDFSCPSAGSTCRWGDYAGATPDPAASLTASSGAVWMTNEWNATSTNPNQVWWRTWNWKAIP